MDGYISQTCKSNQNIYIEIGRYIKSMFWIAYSFIFVTNNFKGFGFRLEISKLLVGTYLISFGTLFQIFGPEHRIDCVHLSVENWACMIEVPLLVDVVVVRVWV